MRIKEENFKGHEAYIIQTLEDFGYYLYFEYNKNIYKITSLYEKKEISKKEILGIINTFKFIEPIDTSDWKVYTNEEFGFEIKYPEDGGISIRKHESRWHKTVLGSVHIILGSGYIPIAITIRSNEEKLSIEKWFQRNYSKDDISKLQEVKFNGIDGIRFSKWSDSIGSFYFSNEDKIYTISPLESQENVENQMKMTEKILSTFKFINN